MTLVLATIGDFLILTGAMVVLAWACLEVTRITDDWRKG